MISLSSNQSKLSKYKTTCMYEFHCNMHSPINCMHSPLKDLRNNHELGSNISAKQNTPNLPKSGRTYFPLIVIGSVQILISAIEPIFKIGHLI